MREVSIESEKISEITNKFMDLGFSRLISSTLACLSCKDEITSYEIERLSGLRQPEVSNAIKDLREIEWISTRKTLKDGTKGRPTELHKAAHGMKKILCDIENSINEKHRIEIEKLRNIKASLE